MGPFGMPMTPGGGSSGGSTDIDGTTRVGNAPHGLFGDIPTVGSDYVSSKWSTFGNNGTKLYIPNDDASSNQVTSFSLSTPYDITSASLDTNTMNFIVFVNNDGMIFNPDGTKIIMFEVSGDPSIKQYDLNTAWNHSDIASSTPSATISNDPSSTFWDRGIFADEGKKFYAMQAALGGKVVEFTCSTAGDLATATAVGSSNELLLSTAQGTGESRGIAMNSYGTRLYVGFDLTGDANEQIFQYDLSTPFDLSTATYNNKVLSGLRSDNFAEIRNFYLVNDTDLYIQGTTTSGAQGMWKYSVPPGDPPVNNSTSLSRVFNGPGNYISYANASTGGTGDFTFETFVEFDSVANDTTIAQMGNTSVRYDAGNSRMELETSAVTGAVSIGTRNYKHIIKHNNTSGIGAWNARNGIVYTGSATDMGVDGVAISQQNVYDKNSGYYYSTGSAAQGYGSTTVTIPTSWQGSKSFTWAVVSGGTVNTSIQANGSHGSIEIRWDDKGSNQNYWDMYLAQNGLFYLGGGSGLDMDVTGGEYGVITSVVNNGNGTTTVGFYNPFNIVFNRTNGPTTGTIYHTAMIDTTAKFIYRQSPSGQNGFDTNLNQFTTGSKTTYKWDSSITTTSANFANSAITPEPGKFKHIAIVRDGTSVNLFIDGVLVDTQTSDANINGNVTIGAKANGSETLDGKMYGLRIAKEQIYTSTFTPPTTALTETTNADLVTLQTDPLPDSKNGASSVITGTVPRSTSSPNVAGGNTQAQASTFTGGIGENAPGAGGAAGSAYAMASPGLSSNFANVNRLKTNGTYTIVGDNGLSIRHTGAGTTGTNKEVYQAGWAWIIRNSDGAVMKSWNGMLNGDHGDSSILDETDTNLYTTSKFINCQWGYACGINDNYCFIGAPWRPVNTNGGAISNNNFNAQRAYLFAYKLSDFSLAKVWKIKDFASQIEPYSNSPMSATFGSAFMENGIEVTNDGLYIGSYRTKSTFGNVDGGAFSYFDISDADPANWSGSPTTVVKNPINVVSTPTTNIGGLNYGNGDFGKGIKVSNANVLVVNHPAWMHRYTQSGSSFSRTGQINPNPTVYDGGYTAISSDGKTYYVADGLINVSSGNEHIDALDLDNSFTNKWTYDFTTNGTPGYNPQVYMHDGADYILAGDGYDDTDGIDAGKLVVIKDDGTELKIVDNPTPNNQKFGLVFDMAGGGFVTRVLPGNNNYALQFMNGSSIFDAVVPLDWSLSSEQQSVTSASQTKNYFGGDVAISGDYMVVGKAGEGFNANYPGTALVYIRSGTTWALQQTLTPSNSTNGDNFGYSVDIDGDYIVVGSYIGNTTGSATHKGGATVFARSGTTWTEEAIFNGQTLSISGTYHYFGYDVGISGDTIIVGAPGVDALGNNAGAAYILRRTGSMAGSYWSADNHPVIPPADQTGIAESNFGHSVAVNGDYAAVSAMQHPYDPAVSAGPGAVWIYVRSGSNWNYQAKLVGTDAVNNDGFGYDLDFAGNDTLICGANNLSSNGYAYVYERSGTAWSETKLTASDGSVGDWFGRDVAINTVTGYSPTAMVGAPREGTGGAVYIFTKVSGTWTQQEKIIQSSPQSGAEFGISVDIDGDYFVVGAADEDVTYTDDGAAYVFYRGADSSGGGAAGAPQGWISIISDELQSYGYTDVQLRALAVDSSNNIIVSGDTAANYHLVVKIKSDGTVDSAASFGASGQGTVNSSVAVDSSNNIFTAGKGPSVWSSSDGHVMRLTSSLTKSYDDFFGEGYPDEHFDVTTDNSGNAFVVGESTSAAFNFTSDPKGHLLKYNSSGSVSKTLITSSQNKSNPQGISSDGTDVYVIAKDQNHMFIAKVNNALSSVTWSKSWGSSGAQDRLMDIDTNSSGESAAHMWDAGSLRIAKLASDGTATWRKDWNKTSTDHGTENPGYNYLAGYGIKLLSDGNVALRAGAMPWTTASYRKSFYIIIFDSTGTVTVEKEFKLTTAGYYLGQVTKALVELSDGKIVTVASYYTGTDWKNAVFKFDPTDTTTAINGTHGDWVISDITDATANPDSATYGNGSVALDTNMSMYFKSGYQGNSNGFSVGSATVVEDTQQTLNYGSEYGGPSPEAGDNTGVSYDFGGGVMLSWSVQDDNVAQSERTLTNATLAAEAQAGDIVVVENSTIQAYNTYLNLGWQLRDSGNLIFVVKAVSGNDLTILYAQEMLYRAQSTGTILNRDFKDHFDNAVNLGSVPADATLGHSYDLNANGTTASQRWLGGTATLYRYFQSDVQSANDTSGGNSNYQVPLPDVTGEFGILGVPDPVWYGDRGLFIGGSNPGNVIQYFDITTLGNAVDFGDLTAGDNNRGSCSNGQRAITSGGGTTPSKETIEVFNIHTLGNSQPFGNLLVKRYSHASFSDGTIGVMAGGLGGPSNISLSDIEYITIDTLGNGTDFGDMQSARKAVAGASNANRGLIVGGWAFDNTIEYITMATPAHAIDFGDLVNGSEYHGATGSATTAIVGGGDTSGGRTNVIQRIQFDTPANAADFGDLTEAKKRICATSNLTRGVFMGGSGGSGNGYQVETIEYVTIATPGNAADFGDLLQTQQLGTSTSGNATNSGLGSPLPNYDRAIFTGGSSSSGGTTPIEYMSISTGGNSVSFGTLSTRRGDHTSTGNRSRALMANGETTGSNVYDQNIEYVVPATLGNGVYFGSNSPGKGGVGSCASDTYALFAGGGRFSGGWTWYSAINYVTIATTGGANQMGNLSSLNWYVAGASNDGTYGYWAGGAPNGGQYVSGIERVTISTSGNASSFGNLSINRAASAGVGDSTYILFAGGGSWSDSGIDQLNAISGGTATKVGDLHAAKYSHASADDRTTGLFAGGYGAGMYNNIEKVTIASAGNAVDVGDLISGRYRLGGTSGSST